MRPNYETLDHIAPRETMDLRRRAPADIGRYGRRTGANAPNAETLRAWRELGALRLRQRMAELKRAR